MRIQLLEAVRETLINVIKQRMLVQFTAECHCNSSCSTCISEPSRLRDEPDCRRRRHERWGWRRRRVCPWCSGTAGPPSSDQWCESLPYWWGTPLESEKKRHFILIWAMSQQCIMLWQILHRLLVNLPKLVGLFGTFIRAYLVVMHPRHRLRTLSHVFVQFVHLWLHFSGKLWAALKSRNPLHCSLVDRQDAEYLPNTYLRKERGEEKLRNHITARKFLLQLLW